MNGTEALAARIAAIRDEGRRPVIVAIDGPCAGGKTTLASRLGVMLDAQVYHMDDFFLQAHQRTAQRFVVPGENVDHERFLEEVLLPLREGRAVVYRPFECGRMAIGGPVPVRNTPVCIVEGSYSLHESLAGLYDLRVLLQVDPQTQRSRILRRNGEEGLRAFEARWIPLENSYFEATDIASRCDVILEPDEAEL